MITIPLKNKNANEPQRSKTQQKQRIVFDNSIEKKDKNVQKTIINRGIYNMSGTSAFKMIDQNENRISKYNLLTL